MSLLSEFKEFIAKGNVMDLAVGVIIGAAFQKIVDSAVNDLIMPFVGVALGGRDFTSMFIVLEEGTKVPGPYASLVEARAAGAAVFAYGAFLTQLMMFIILAWIVFMLVKAVNRMRRTTPVIP